MIKNKTINNCNSNNNINYTIKNKHNNFHYKTNNHIIINNL